MLLFLLLLQGIICCCAQGDVNDNPPISMTMGAARTPELADLTKDEQPETQWRKEVLTLLAQLVQAQRDDAARHAELVKQLGTLGTQGAQQIQSLQNIARHQSLLVENHQALLLQASRIATHLQDLAKKPAPPSDSHQ